MGKKLERIMLIDDDINTNLYNEIILNQANAAEEIVIYQNAKEALAFLETGENNVDLIFLDINMPVTNGWQFLEKYEKLSDSKKAKNIIVMLTASINKDDKEKALSFNIVENFISKPLSVDVVRGVIDSLQKA